MAYWIWFPHDFEIDLRGKVEMRRQEHGMTLSVHLADGCAGTVHCFPQTLSFGQTRPHSNGQPGRCLRHVGRRGGQR